VQVGCLVLDAESQQLGNIHGYLYAMSGPPPYDAAVPEPL